MLRTRVLAAVAVVPLLLAAGCGSSGTDASGSGGSSGPACSYVEGGAGSKAVDLPPDRADSNLPTELTISTSAGDIPVTFDVDEAPCTVNSFVSLAEQGYYDKTPCHRLVTSGIYVLQCGDPTGTGTGGPGYTIPDEVSDDDPRLAPCTDSQDAAGQPVRQCTYPNGGLAMANTGQPDSGGSQFFLVYSDSPLPPSYTLFGHTDASGLAVIKAIAAKGTATGATDGPPKDAVTIERVE